MKRSLRDPSFLQPIFLSAGGGLWYHTKDVLSHVQNERVGLLKHWGRSNQMRIVLQTSKDSISAQDPAAQRSLWSPWLAHCSTGQRSVAPSQEQSPSCRRSLLTRLNAKKEASSILLLFVSGCVHFRPFPHDCRFNWKRASVFYSLPCKNV